METNQLVSCYFNLHKKVFSVKQGRHPIEHFDWVLLSDCSFRVRESGRQRVLQEKRRGVHAYVKGKVIIGSKTNENFLLEIPKYQEEYRIRYNPYLHGYFFFANNENPIYECEECLLINKKIYKTK